MPDLKIIKPIGPLIFAHGRTYDFTVGVENVGQQSADIVEVSLTVSGDIGVGDAGPIGVGETKYVTIPFTVIKTWHLRYANYDRSTGILKHVYFLQSCDMEPVLEEA